MFRIDGFQTPEHLDGEEDDMQDNEDDGGFIVTLSVCVLIKPLSS